MSILSEFEDRVSRAVEGMFSGVFRSPVQPAELARALAKQMDRGRTLSVGKVFAPNLYTILLSPDDDDQLGRFASTLAGELATYLTGVARERGYTIDGKPHVRFLVDKDLRMGRFEAFAELVSADELAEELGGETWDADDVWTEGDEPPAARPAHDAPRFVPTPHPARVQPSAVPVSAVPYAEDELDGPSAETSVLHAADWQPMATVTISGTDHDVVLRGDRMVVGRLTGCDICLEDRSASREHAVFTAEGSGWALEDLGSTNGTLLNGNRLARERLRDGDRITIGLTELIYHEPRR